ncbi:motility associated factor glycosyltransferase family protein [Tepidibacillus infernus]|uniref:motility associated factor glycosyltransferase family protein n=1 Tax=Tepidibacillus infernus TaxID=1806172 RepID=UPI003B73799E
MDIYERNLFAYKKKYMDFEIIDDETYFVVEMGKNQNPTIKFTNNDAQYYFHSKYDPVNEAKRWADSFYEEGNISILIGLGLGYHAKSLLKKMDKEDYMIIIEPSKEIFQLAIQNVDLTDLINNKQVFIHIGTDYNGIRSILEGFNRQQFRPYKINISHHYDKLFNEEIKSILKIIEEAIMSYKIDLNTRIFFSEKWQENYLRNLKHAINSIPFKVFEDKFTSPVIIVSAGPSLKEEIDYLKTIHNRAIIICSGSAITILEKYNIKPHIIVSIDGDLENYNHFKKLKNRDRPLFYSPHLHYKILDEYLGPKIVFQPTGIGIYNWYNEMIGFETGTVYQGSSVANGVLDIATRISSGPICFIGQDLGYTGGYSHPEGHNHRKSLDSIKNNNRNLFTIESNDGSKLFTDYVYYGMKKWFEDYLDVKKLDHVYNATLKGAKIKGTKPISFQKFIEKFCTIETDIEAMISDIIFENKNDTMKVNSEEKIDEIKNVVSTFIEYSSKGEKISKELLETVINNKSDDKKINKLLVKLNKVDRKIHQLNDKDLILYFIKQPLMIKMEFWKNRKKTDDEKNDVSIAEKNYYFYKELNSMANKVKVILEQI